MIGQNKWEINVVPYQSGWKDLYEKEAALLQKALGKSALKIEHIGSTAIPGMVAKPRIDIVVAVVSLAKAKELIPLLEVIGYQHRPHDTISERLFFVKESSPFYRTHHLNLAEQKSVFWKNQLSFRNYLRTHKQIATEYAELKRSLAENYSRTQSLDVDAKSDFVTRVLALAEKEETEDR